MMNTFKKIKGLKVVKWALTGAAFLGITWGATSYEVVNEAPTKEWTCPNEYILAEDGACITNEFYETTKGGM